MQCFNQIIQIPTTSLHLSLMSPLNLHSNLTVNTSFENIRASSIVNRAAFLFSFLLSSCYLFSQCLVSIGKSLISVLLFSFCMTVRSGLYERPDNHLSLMGLLSIMKLSITLISLEQCVITSNWLVTIL